MAEIVTQGHTRASVNATGCRFYFHSRKLIFFFRKLYCINLFNEELEINITISFVLLPEQAIENISLFLHRNPNNPVYSQADFIFLIFLDHIALASVTVKSK